MANTDVTVTLAGQFQPNVLSPLDRLLVEIGAKYAWLNLQQTVPTAAQWNTAIKGVLACIPHDARPFGPIRSALYW